MLSQIVKFVISVFFVVLIAAIYALLSLDLNDYKQQIEQAAEDATGRELRLEGDVSLAWSLIPSLEVEKAHFANASWASQADMISLDKLEVRLALWQLLKREIQVTKVLLNQPTIALETNAKGVGNWVFPQQAESTDDQQQGESAIQSVIVNVLDIHDAKINYIDGVNQQQQQFDIEQLSITAADLKLPMDLVFKAILDELPVDIEGQVGGLQALLDNQKTLVDLDADISGLSVNIVGNVAKLHAGKGVSLALDVDTDDETLATLLGPETVLPAFGSVQLTGQVSNELDSETIRLDLTTFMSGLELVVKGEIAEPQTVAGIDLDINLVTSSSAVSTLVETTLPPLGDIQLRGSLRGDQQAMSLSGIELIAGDSDLSGDINVNLAGDKPSLVVNLQSTLLDLMPLSQGEAEAAETSAKTDKLFSDDPLVLDGLKQVNADVVFTAKTIQSTGASLQDVKLKLELTDGHLKVLPVTAGFAGSQIEAKLDLDARNDVAQLATQLQINGFKLNKVAALQDAISGGNTDVFVEATGQGDSVSALMAGLNGKAIAKVAESQIADGTLDILGADFVTELVNLLNPFKKEKAGTELVCAVVNFNIRDGIAKADKGIAVRTGKMNIVGDGTINLKNEKIDIGITPEGRTGIGVSMTDLVGLVRVGGTLAEPSALVDKTAVLGVGLSTGAAVATGGLSVVAEGLVDRATADADPCQTALGIKKASPEKTN